MTQNLTEFFREKKNRADSNPRVMDWDHRRKNYVEAVKSLYAMIEQILAEPIAQGSVTVGRTERMVEDRGLYQSEDLLLEVGDEKVTFSPAGFNVYGAEGRVDVSGESGEGTLVLQPGPRWLVVASKYPQLRVVELNADTLGELLQAVMRR